MRVKFDEDKCKGCMRCVKECPMDVDMRSNSRRRTKGTDCILCMRCISICREEALHL
ncbi:MULTISPECIES: 4Fe-4S binding protein [Methanothermobacter]|uniref:4Fe-4S binding protein n=1 Tax=Methanothermobacter TaxID=145260 RepID=UPI00352A1170